MRYRIKFLLVGNPHDGRPTREWESTSPSLTSILKTSLRSQLSFFNPGRMSYCRVQVMGMGGHTVGILEQLSLACTPNSPCYYMSLNVQSHMICTKRGERDWTAKLLEHRHAGCWPILALHHCLLDDDIRARHVHQWFVPDSLSTP